MAITDFYLKSEPHITTGPIVLHREFSVYFIYLLEVCAKLLRQTLLSFYEDLMRTVTLGPVYPTFIKVLYNSSFFYVLHYFCQ